MTVSSQQQQLSVSHVQQEGCGTAAGFNRTLEGLGQWSPSFLAPGFVEDTFPMDESRGCGVGGVRRMVSG